MGQRILKELKWEFPGISAVKVEHFGKTRVRMMQYSLFVVENVFFYQFISVKSLLCHSKWPVMFLWGGAWCRFLALFYKYFFVSFFTYLIFSYGLGTGTRGTWDRILWPSTEPSPPAWEHRVSATGPPGKSLVSGVVPFSGEKNWVNCGTAIHPSICLFIDSKFSSIFIEVWLTNQNCMRGEGNDTPLQYSCLENPMDGGVW